MSAAAGNLTPKGQSTRARILAAAGDELLSGGGLEIAAVAKRAKVTASVLYRYFGNKDGLVETVVNAFYDEYDAAVFDAKLAPESSWIQREELRIDREVAFLYQHRLGRAIAAGLLHEAAATRADAERLRRHAALAARNIERGQRSGELPTSVDAGLAGAAIIGALRAVLAEALGRSPAPAQSEVARMVRRIGIASLVAG